MKPRITTIRFLLLLTGLVAVAGLMIGYLMAAIYGNTQAKPTLIFISLMAPLLVMTLTYWLLRLAGK